MSMFPSSVLLSGSFLRFSLPRSLTNNPKTSCCTLDTTLLELNTHELISDPVPFEWLCREMCGIGRKLFQYFVDTIFAFFLLGIA